MKNIYVLPTNKPTWLHKSLLSGVLRKSSSCIDDMRQAQGMNIYITTDEEIKEGDFVIEYIFDNLVFKVCSITSKNVQKSKFNSFPKKHCKKIILTTDQDLIKDGVQAIDDKFLEYFVKNPSCEFVKTEKWLDDEGGVLYSRTIPKEERVDILDMGQITSKEQLFKHKVEVLPKKEILENRSNAYDFIDFDKQETLEEAAERIFNIPDDKKGDVYFASNIAHLRKGFKFGAEWQQEQDKNKFSEEEVIELIQFLSMNEEFRDYSSVSKNTAKFFIQQFKNK